MGKFIGWWRGAGRRYAVPWQSLLLICLFQGWTPAYANISCSTVNSPAISNLPGRLNVTSADLSIVGSTLTAKMYLKQLPATVQLNAPANGLNALEYWWGVDIDTDNNPATGGGGSDSGYEYSMATSHFKTSNTPSTISFGSGFQTDVWANGASGNTNVGPATLTVSTVENAITLSANIPGISSSSRFRLAAYDGTSGLGFVFFVLPCQSGTAAPGNCTVVQSPNTVAAPVDPGTTVTLTATCGTGSPVTSCTWNGGLPSACTVKLLAQATTTTYTLTAANASGSAPPVDTTVYIRSSVPGNCSITTSPSSSAQSPLAAGTQVQLTVTCAAGATPSTYSWSVGGQGAQINVSPSTTTTYTVTPSNASGTGAPVSITVYVAASAGTAPGSCSVSQSPNTVASPVSPGTVVNLVLTCASGNPVTSCKWVNSAGLQGTTTACDVSLTAPAATSTYTVTAVNAGGSAPAVATTIYVTTVSSKLATAISITGNTPNPSTAQPVTVMVNLSVVPPGTGTPTGAITVSYGSDSCTIALPNNYCTLSPSSLGTKSLIATYGGDSAFAGSTSAAVSQTVNGTTQTGPISFPGGPPITVDVSGNAQLTSAENIDPNLLPPLPLPNFSVPALASFTMSLSGTNPVATVTVTYDTPIPPGAQYWKFGYNINDAPPRQKRWYPFPNATPISTYAWQLTLTDGGLGDDDLAKNGLITDPGGMVIPNGTVVEFYNSILDNFFITANPDEQAAVRNGAAGPGWAATGDTFKSGGASHACRFYGSLSPGPNSHFYTIYPNECQLLKDLQASTPANLPRWNFESLDFMSKKPDADKLCPPGLAPVYRAYNNGYNRKVDSNHRITTNLGALQQVVARGWINEGIVMCAPQ